MQKKYFLLDLEKSISSLDITYILESDLKADLKAMGLRQWHQVDSFDLKIFDKEVDAEKYLEKYLSAFEDLKKMQNKINKNLPAIRYRRRYLIQTLLGEKLFTNRSYEKNWSKGQKFNFHDQTYTITVELESITKESEGNYRYDFKNT